MQKLICASLAALALVQTPVHARPFTAKDMATLNRVGAPAISPDGKWMAYQMRSTDLAANKGRIDLYLLDISRPGQTPKMIASKPDKNETSPTFSPDGKWLYYLSNESGDDQLWRVAIAGGTPSQLSDAKDGIAGFKIAPTGDKAAVWADRPVGAKTLADVKPDAKPEDGSARIYDKMFVRHWDAWSDGQRSQIFVMPLTGGTDARNAISVMGGLEGDTPSKPFGGSEEIAWVPDGKTLYFALREAGRIEPLSTNLDIFAAPADGSAAPTNLTDANDATDTLPAVSPDGNWLAYAAMKRPGYESDRQVLMLRDIATGQTRAVTESWDRSVASIAWSPDGKSIYVTAQDTLDEPVFSIDVTSGKIGRAHV